MTEEAKRPSPRQGQQAILKDLTELYDLVVAQSGASSPTAQKLQGALQRAQRIVQLARGAQRTLARRVIALRTQETALWRLLLTMLADGGERNEPPLGGLHDRLDVGVGAPPWPPGTGLAPPADSSPQIIQRQ
jgi:hypothetical protein